MTDVSRSDRPGPAASLAAVPSPSRDRLTELFLKLARIPSPPKHERRMADAVIERLQPIGVTVHEDDTAATTGGEAGNLWCTVSGEGEPHIALGAHLDTVAPTDDIDPFLDGDAVFRNRRRTILGADDKAAVAALIHATELLKASGRDFPTYELLFTVSEEIGLVGAKHFNEKALASPFAAVFDSAGPVGGITVKAPSHETFKATFRGQAAHAGVEPEKGRSAIQAAAKAIAAMELGRVDEETSANIGVIRGGVGTNIVPDTCEVEGECRSHDEEKLSRVAASIVDALHAGAAQVGVDVDIALVHEYRAFALTGRSAVVRLSRAALLDLGLEPTLQSSGGGSDANILNARGLPTVNLSAGMTQVHSPEEHVSLDDLERLCALALRMILMAPDFVHRSRITAPAADE
jgi:tripeptide aminopeptidase